MKLSDLLENAEVKIPFADVEITGITNNTYDVKEGYLYACIKGEKTDGHDFAQEAFLKGAAAVIAEHTVGLENEIIVKNSLKAYSYACFSFFGNPQKRLKLIGVTGTNGKTSTVNIIHRVLESCGIKCGLAGTIINNTGKSEYQSQLTTPDASYMAKLLKEMADNGCEYAVMEVSSHALKQQRMYPCEFEVAVFTNLTPEHLDYHKTMEDYLCSKKQLFYRTKTAIMNMDDDYFEQISQGLNCPIFTYSTKNRYADYKAENIISTADGVRYELINENDIQRINFCTPGLISVYNTMSAISVLSQLGVPLSKSADTIKNMQGIKGRLEPIKTDRGFDIIIDYAHTPDGLFNTLKTVKDFTKGRLIALFGCGGDRDRSKRAEMGKIATSIADVSIITSDNPRTEPPINIINDILKGAQKGDYIVIPNREEAIREAISIASANDTILLAGKGHEDYQIIGKTKIHFDEREIIKKYI